MNSLYLRRRFTFGASAGDMSCFPTLVTLTLLLVALQVLRGKLSFALIGLLVFLLVATPTFGVFWNLFTIVNLVIPLLGF